MPQPQPGPDRPADGSTPGPDQGRDPALTEEPTSSPATPAPTGGTGPEGTRELPADDPGATDRAEGAVATATPDAATATPETSVAPPDAVAAPGSAAAEPGDTPPALADGRATNRPAVGPQGTRLLPGDGPVADSPAVGPQGTRPLTADRPAEAPPAVGPQGTRMFPGDERPAEPPAPRWSGSAPVPPPRPRKRTWGESAEPTPVPPLPVEPPEHRTPVDPWAGADTGGWELPSAELPPLPPTLPYPAAPPVRPHPAPPVHSPAPPVHSPAPAPPRPAPPRHAPPGHDAPPVAHPVSPPPVARPAPPPVSRAAVPVQPAAPPPPPPAPPRQRRAKTPPAAPPPGFQAPKGYVPVAVRKRRRWPWVLLLTLACCCGCPAYYGVPMASQYPASATLPAEVADLRLRDDNSSKETAKRLEAEVRKAHWLAEDTFAGVYSTSAGKRVTVFGGTGFRLTPESDAQDEITRLAGQYSLGEAQVVDTGVRGRHERCAVGRADGDDVVVCTSVDHGSITTAVFTRLSVDDSAALLGTLREQIVTAKQG